MLIARGEWGHHSLTQRRPASQPHGHLSIGRGHTPYPAPGLELGLRMEFRVALIPCP